MFLTNALVHSHRNLVVYDKTIDDIAFDNFCKQMSYLFLKNKDFRKQLQNCQHFNLFGYNITSPSAIYIPDNYIYEQRFCAFNQLSASQMNTVCAGIGIKDRKLIAPHLHVSLPTTHGHFNNANKLMGVQTDEQAIIVIQNF